MKELHPKKDREDFIKAFIERYGCADVLDRDFHERYDRSFPGYMRDFKMIGSSPVKQAMRDLKRMLDEGVLERCPVGIQGLCGMGFPRWVWSYRLKNDN